MGDLTENFSSFEFRCNCGCNNDNISMELVRRLQVTRDMLGRPIRINSGVRCPDHNKSIGGEEDSEHVPLDGRPGEGADIPCEDNNTRYELLLRLINRFDRIGVYPKHIHVGIRETKPKEVLWLG